MDTIYSGLSDSNPSQKYLTKWLPFEEARTFVHSLELKNADEWRDYCKSKQKPTGIPTNLYTTYKDQFQGMGDWLGTYAIATYNREYLPFEEAREYTRSLGFKNGQEWKNYSQSGQKPVNIPSLPWKVYKQSWQNWGDWLGTSIIAARLREYLPFGQARSYVQTLRLKSNHEWREYSKSDMKPANIPSDPHHVYKSEFHGYGDWLGTGTIAPQNYEYIPFEEAQVYVRTLGLKNTGEWRDFCKSGGKPTNIPVSPHLIYRNDWQSWGTWLGTGTLSPQAMNLSSEQRLAHRRVSSHKMRAHRKTVLGTHTAAQIQEQLRRQKYRCYYAACGFSTFKKRDGGYVYHVDHTFPLSRVAGTNIPANTIDYLVLACPTCNLSKHDKFPWEWPEGGRLL